MSQLLLVTDWSFPLDSLDQVLLYCHAHLAISSDHSLVVVGALGQPKIVYPNPSVLPIKPPNVYQPFFALDYHITQHIKQGLTGKSRLSNALALALSCRIDSCRCP